MTRPIPNLLILIAIALPLSLLAGRVWLDFSVTPNAAIILAELRLPRSVLALVIGAGLGAAGAAIRSPIPACSASRRWRRWARWRVSGWDILQVLGCCRYSR